jgi:hypothetical protein
MFSEITGRIDCGWNKEFLEGRRKEEEKSLVISTV